MTENYTYEKVGTEEEKVYSKIDKNEDIKDKNPEIKQDNEQFKIKTEFDLSAWRSLDDTDILNHMHAYRLRKTMEDVFTEIKSKYFLEHIISRYDSAFPYGVSFKAQTKIKNSLWYKIGIGREMKNETVENTGLTSFIWKTNIIRRYRFFLVFTIYYGNGKQIGSVFALSNETLEKRIIDLFNRLDEILKLEKRLNGLILQSFKQSVKDDGIKNMAFLYVNNVSINMKPFIEA